MCVMMVMCTSWTRLRTMILLCTCHFTPYTQANHCRLNSYAALSSYRYEYILASANHQTKCDTNICYCSAACVCVGQNVFWHWEHWTPTVICAPLIWMCTHLLINVNFNWIEVMNEKFKRIEFRMQIDTHYVLDAFQICVIKCWKWHLAIMCCQ